MKDKQLLCVMAAIIWSSQRGQLADADEHQSQDLEDIREAVKFAGDIMVEVDEYLKPEPKSNVLDAEFTDEEAPRARRAR